VEVERDIMDEILVVRRDAARHKHGFRRRAASVCPSSHLEGGGGARPAATRAAAGARTAHVPAPTPPALAR
jgi:hypothetical protein